MAERQPPQQQPDEITRYRPMCHVDYPMLDPGRRGLYDALPNHDLKIMASKLNALDDEKLFIA